MWWGKAVSKVHFEPNPIEQAADPQPDVQQQSLIGQWANPGNGRSPRRTASRTSTANLGKAAAEEIAGRLSNDGRGVDQGVEDEVTIVRLVYECNDGRNDVEQHHGERPSQAPAAGNDAVNTEDMVVRRHWCLGTKFYAISKNCVDEDMEERFANARYMNFKGAFTQASFFMTACAMVLALFGYFEDRRWGRCIILAGVVMPLYASYGIFVMKREKHYFRASGTMYEKIIIALLSLQSAAICSAEWYRDTRIDYGMFVIHIGFVHNFTPLGTNAMHVVTTVFGLLPYLLLKIFRDGPTEPSENVEEGNCPTTGGSAKFILELLVPCLLLTYQVVVTTRRDESLRRDLLNSEQLRMQKQQFQTERQKCEDLLMSMLPRQIIGRLKNNEAIAAQAFNEVTVIFVEISDFSHLCDRLKPQDVVEVLNIIYLEFDRLSDLLHVYKVETVGQVYMAVVGCPLPVKNHADVAAHFALAAQHVMVRLGPRLARIECPSGQLVPWASAPGQLQCPPSTEDEGLRICIRVGLNSGKIRAGVVGLDSPRYKLFGDTVNTASRMESTCIRGGVQASQATYQRLTPNVFVIEDRGEQEVKGKGLMPTVLVHGYQNETSPLQPRDVRIIWDRGVVEPEKLDDSRRDLLASWPEEPSPQDVTLSQPASKAQTIGHPIVPTVSIPSRSPQWLRNSIMPAFPGFFISDEAVGDAGSRHLIQWGFGPAHASFGNLFLLVPPAQKDPAWLRILRADKLLYVELTVSSRIAAARNITISWLLLVALVSIIDYRLVVIEENIDAYRSAIIFRTLGNEIAGLVYLLLLTNRELFLLYAQRLTVLMLTAQGAALVSTSNAIYNSEVAIIAMYGAYVLFYTVCTMRQRMTVCCSAVVAYIITEYVRCGSEGVQTAIANIAFLSVFFLSSACAVRLEEHLAHVSHYNNRRVVKELETINQTRSTGTHLLLSLLPAHVVERVSEGISPIAEFHSDVTIIFTDMKGYTAYCKNLPPHELVDFLNSVYSSFDEIIGNWALHKVEVIGDAYFISAGCPPHEEDHSITRQEWAMRAVEVALALQRSLPSVCDDPTVQMRIGLHTGSVVAGVVGKKGPRYHLFGPTVHYAEAMESNGVPGKVQISDATHQLLCKYDYTFEPRQITIDNQPAKTWLVHKGNNKIAFQIQKRLMIMRRHSAQKAQA